MAARWHKRSSLRRQGPTICRMSHSSWLCLDDLSERQVYPLTDILLRLRNLMFPKLLHRSRHDDERAIADLEALRLFRLVVLDPKCPGRSQGQ